MSTTEPTDEMVAAARESYADVQRDQDAAQVGRFPLTRKDIENNARDRWRAALRAALAVAPAPSDDDREALHSEVARVLRVFTGRVRTELDATRAAGIDLGAGYLAGVYSALQQADDHADDHAAAALNEAAALRAPVPVETVTTIEELDAPEPRSTSEVVMPRETLEERIHADGELWTRAFDQGVAMAPVLGAPGWVRWLLLRLARSSTEGVSQ